MRRLSLQGRFLVVFGTLVVACTITAAMLVLHWPDAWLVLPLLAALTIAAAAFAVRRFFAPIETILRALQSGVASFKDHDYGVTIAARRSDELGALVEVYNDLARSLREERFGLFQRELMLDTVIQSSAVAVFITGSQGALVYANREGAALLRQPGALEGRSLLPLCADRSEALASAVCSGRDGLFSIGGDGEEQETLHLTCRQFNLNGGIHRLYLVKQLTREISRREVETWKKVIRVITHEMNNSLAPISSLIASAQKIARSDSGRDKLDDIYASIANRAAHLQSFIEQYARFARLPRPRCENVQWPAFIGALRGLATFELAEDLPADSGWFDPAQMEQALLNLLKNAAESGSAPRDIQLRVLQGTADALIAVEDRGSGMSAEQMQLALLPFYSTKRNGTGLGLPLCREIVEAHGGSFNLFNREQGGTIATCRLPRRLPVGAGGAERPHLDLAAGPCPPQL